MSRIWNSINSREIKVGGTLPILWSPTVTKRVYGAIVKNVLDVGEKVSAGTPFYHNVETREATFLKLWKIAGVEVSETNTIVSLHKTSTTPKLKSGAVIMVMPSTLSGTGKAAACGAVTESGNRYSVTLVTDSYDALSAGGFLVEAVEAGSGKAILCQPNNISIEDCIGGSEGTMVDVPYGIVPMFENTIPFMPSVVKNAVGSGDAKIVWEYFNQIS